MENGARFNVTFDTDEYGSGGIKLDKNLGEQIRWCRTCSVAADGEFPESITARAGWAPKTTSWIGEALFNPFLGEAMTENSNGRDHRRREDVLRLRDNLLNDEDNLHSDEGNLHNDGDNLLKGKDCACQKFGSS